MMRRALASLILASMTVLLAACGGSDSADKPEAAALTQEQAELLATTRFYNFDAGLRAVTVTIPAPEGAKTSTGIKVSGWADFAEHLGYAGVTQGDATQGLLLWSGDRIAISQSATGIAELPVPSTGWRSADLVADTSPMTQSLAIVTSLGSDRPENPLLLRQSDAAFLRNDTIDGKAVMVIAGPSPQGSEKSTPLKNRVRYWIDKDGLLLRVEAKLAGTSGWTRIDLVDTTEKSLGSPDKMSAILSR